MPCVAVAFDTPAAECRARNRARPKRIPADVLAGQLRAWPAVRDGLADRGVRPGARAGAGAGGAGRRSPRGRRGRAPAARATRPGCGSALHLGEFVAPGGAAGDRASWLREIGRGRRGGRLRRDLRDGPLPADPAGRPAVRRHAGELDHAGLPRRLHRAGPARHAGQRHHLPQRRAPRRRSSPPSTCSAAAARCAALGLAWFAEEHRAYGWDFPPTADRYALLEDALQLLPVLWGPGSPPFHGRVLDVPETLCYPRPLQEHVPLVVGGGGERRTLRLAARYADAANVIGDAATSYGARRRCCARTAPTSAGTRRGRADPPVDGAGRAGRRAGGRAGGARCGRAGAARRATRRRSTPARSPTRSAGSASSPRPASREVMVRLPDLADPASLERFGEVIAAFR